MRILVLGGTVFLGRHFVDLALEEGHEVTVFHRGQHHPELFEGRVERVLGDRNRDLERLSGRSWDAIVDTCGYLPSQLRATSTALGDACAHYLFVSTASVYEIPLPEGHPAHGREPAADGGVVDEGWPTVTHPDPCPEQLTGETYGRLKLLSERTAAEALGDKLLTVRPGLIVGPHDPSDRFTYWVRRVALGGDVLTPGEPSSPVQFVDVRDLAEFMLHAIGQKQAGVLNVAGPAAPLTMGELLEACREVAAEEETHFHWAPAAFMQERGIAPYIDMPLWLPPPVAAMNQVSSAAATARGLSFRPLAETIRDTLDWYLSDPEGSPVRVGLDRDREDALLDALLDR